MKTIDQIIEENPWMEAFRDKMRDKCHDCGVLPGEQHIEGCDTARCTNCNQQRLACDCTTGEPSDWNGLMYPELHKKCLDHNLWCRDAIIEPDGSRSYPSTPEEYQRLHKIVFNEEPGSIKWHIPCELTDPGAHADLNRAAKIKG